MHAYVSEWLPPPPARVLEVGCGDGSLTRLLAADGFEVTGLDPEAPEGQPFVRGSLEDFRMDGSFDAAVAIRSLHHVHDLRRALDSLRAALRPHAPLVLFADLRAALSERFWLVLDEPAAYFARDAGRQHLVPVEEAAIASGELRRARARLVYESRP
jgi:2-polyprenyl-3-methyl-5-hydroxy-6-metoxy-1,4-benzoquinol methylase